MRSDRASNAHVICASFKRLARRHESLLIARLRPNRANSLNSNFDFVAKLGTRLFDFIWGGPRPPASSFSLPHPPPPHPTWPGATLDPLLCRLLRSRAALAPSRLLRGSRREAGCYLCAPRLQIGSFRCHRSSERSTCERQDDSQIRLLSRPCSGYRAASGPARLLRRWTKQRARFPGLLLCIVAVQF